MCRARFSVFSQMEINPLWPRCCTGIFDNDKLLDFHIESKYLILPIAFHFPEEK